MELTKLLTLGFAENVGRADRVLRIVGGVALAVGGFTLGLGLWAAGALSVLGVMTALSGFLSRCSIYYVLGYSTCPLRDGRPDPRRA